MKDLRIIAADILGIDTTGSRELVELRRGARTRTLFATPAGLQHPYIDRASRVVVKIYKGDWSTAGGKEYETYHADHFQRVPVLQQSPFIQKSITAGIHRNYNGTFPYAVLQYIEGEELADLIRAGNMDPARALNFIEQLLLDIWIPLWDGGLRFKDCHPGNFIVTGDDRVCMIDTEQMRKDAAELLTTPKDWRKRQAHEDMGLARLPGLLSRILAATRDAISEATAKKRIKDGINSLDLSTNLSRLDRGGDRIAVEKSVRDLIDLIQNTY
jgi:hypothetical protein